MTERHRGLNLATTSDRRRLAAEDASQEDRMGGGGGSQAPVPLASDDYWFTHVTLTVRTRRLLEVMKRQLGKRNISRVLDDAVEAYAKEQDLSGFEAEIEVVLPMHSANKNRTGKM